MADEKKGETKVAAKAKSVYETLSAIDCRRESRKKNGLTYLPWAWAWARVKEHFPLATYTIYEDAAGRFYHTDGRTAWVKTGVTIEGVELIEYLPVMDFRNASIPLEKLTSFDVNKSIQRSLTKACARHGLGLYIFAGEDLPEGAEEAAKPAAPAAKPAQTAPRAQNAQKTADGAKAAMTAAWKAFLATPTARGMDANARGNYFAAEVKRLTGCAPRDVAAADWAKVAATLAPAGAEEGGGGDEAQA